MQQFTDEKLSGEKSLFDAIKKLKLKKFTSKTKTIVTSSDKNLIPMKATLNLSFGPNPLVAWRATWRT